MALGFIKASLLLLYYRILHRIFHVVRGMRLAMYMVISFVALFTTQNVLKNFFLCIPLRKFWSPAISGRCIADTSAIWIINTILDILTDFSILLLPMPAFKHLNLSRRRKFGIIFVFALGFLSCIVNVVRLYTIIAVNHSDPTYYGTSSLMWASIHVNTGMICACLPPMYPIFARLSCNH